MLCACCFLAQLQTPPWLEVWGRANTCLGLRAKTGPKNSGFEFTLFSKKSYTARLDVSFGGFEFTLFFWRKIYKCTNSHAALPSAPNPRVGRFSRKGTLEDLDALLFSDSNLKVVRSPNLHHLRDAVRVIMRSKNVRLQFSNFKKFISQSSDLEDW